MMLLLVVSPARGATELEIQLKPSKAMPVVGDEVRLTVEMTHRGTRPITLADLKVEHVLPDESVRELAYENELSALEPGQTATVRASFTPALTGFHHFRVTAPRGGGEALVLDAGRLPVHAEALTLMYWRGPQSMENLTWRLCVSGDDPNYWASRGVVAARWAPGISKRSQNWTRDQFVERWSEPLPPGYTAIAIDEFGGVAGTPTDLEMSAALVALKEKDLDRQVAVWSIKFHPDSEQTRAYQQAADVLMIEVYSSHFAAYGRFAREWAEVKEAGLADKTIFALWFDRVITTEQSLHEQIRHIRRTAPESKGLCLNGDATEELFHAADRLVHEYFVKPVLLIEENAAGRWQCRNIGWMSARDVRLPTAGNAAPSRTLETIEPGEVVDLTIPSGEALTLPPGESYTWLYADEDINAVDASMARSPEPALPESPTTGGVHILTGSLPVAEGQNPTRLPIAGVDPGKPFTLTFDIAFDRLQPYGIIAVGLGHDELPDYTDAFLKYFDRSSSSPGRLEMRFFRGDIEISSATYKIRGARGIFGYENAEGEFVRTTSAMPFEAGKSYRVWIHREPASVQVVARCLDGPADQVWRSGPLRIDTQARFNEAYVRVREGAASSIVLNPQRGEAVVRSGTQKSDDDRVRASATLSNFRLIPTEEH